MEWTRRVDHRAESAAHAARAVHATTHESTPRDADERAPPPATTVHGPRSRSGVGGERGRGVFLRRRGPGLRGGAAIHDHAIVHMQRVCSAGSAPCGGWCALWAGAWLERGGEFERSAARVYALYPRVTRTRGFTLFSFYIYRLTIQNRTSAAVCTRAVRATREPCLASVHQPLCSPRVPRDTLSRESDTLSVGVPVSRSPTPLIIGSKFIRPAIQQSNSQQEHHKRCAGLPCESTGSHPDGHGPTSPRLPKQSRKRRDVTARAAAAATCRPPVATYVRPPQRRRLRTPPPRMVLPRGCCGVVGPDATRSSRCGAHRRGGWRGAVATARPWGCLPPPRPRGGLARAPLAGLL